MKKRKKKKKVEYFRFSVAPLKKLEKMQEKKTARSDGRQRAFFHKEGRKK